MHETKKSIRRMSIMIIGALILFIVVFFILLEVST